MIIHIRGGEGGGEGGIVQNNSNITQTMHIHKQNTKKKIHPLYITQLTFVKIGFLVNPHDIKIFLS